MLTDISTEVFECILNFIYTDELPKEKLNIREIYAAASKLKIQKLKQVASKLWEDEMKGEDLDDLMEYFDQGIKLDCDKLKSTRKLRILIEAKKIEDKFTEK